MAKRMAKAALQAAIAARLTLGGPVQRPLVILDEATRQHDGSADRERARIREGVRVLTELERAERLALIGDALGPAVQPNRAQRRAEARADRRSPR